MFSVNEVRLLGHVGNKPELRYTPAGTPVFQFSMATNAAWKDDQGEKQARTDWHRVEVWGALATACGERVAKGTPVYVAGELREKSWQKDGETRRSAYVKADQVVFLAPKVSGNAVLTDAQPEGEASAVRS